MANGLLNLLGKFLKEKEESKTKCPNCQSTNYTILYEELKSPPLESFHPPIFITRPDYLYTESMQRGIKFYQCNDCYFKW